VLADGRLYHLSQKGRTLVLAASPKFEELAVNDLRDRSALNAGLAGDGGRMYLRSDRFLSCPEKKCVPAWRPAAPKQGAAAPPGELAQGLPGWGAQECRGRGSGRGEGVSSPQNRTTAPPPCGDGAVVRFWRRNGLK
jgi:hypothetical protein